MDNIIKPKIVTAFDNPEGMTAVIHDAGKKKLIDIPVEWFFYIRFKDYDVAKIIFGNYRAIVKKLEKQGEYIKVYVDMPYQHDVNIAALRDSLESNNVEVFEYDLNKTKRKMIDEGYEIETDLKILYFDIETDDSKGGISIGRDRILSWAACDNEDSVLFETGDEKEILKKFISTIKKYDLISGWNSGEFDLPYIKARCELYNIIYDWRQIIHVDMMQRCFKIYSYEASIIGLKNFSLNEISRCFLGKQKADTQGLKIHELFATNIEKLKEYNIQDTLLLKELDNKLNIISLMVTECSWTGSFLFKFYIGELLDNYILREAKKRGLILKSKPSKKTKELLDSIHITGGYVATPINGLYRHVNICDFKSLYPSIIVGWNIGQDSIDIEKSKKGFDSLKTFLKDRKIEDVSFIEWHDFLMTEKKKIDPLNECIQAANNVYFKRNVQSFIGDLVEGLLTQRADYKKKLKTLTMDTPEYNNAYAAERVVKEMANSMFGITCDKSSRYFDQYTSEAITYTGQYLNKLSSYVVADMGLKSIYGDTDSIFVIGSDDLSTDIDEINEKLKSFLDINITLRKNIVSIDYEKHYSKLLLLEKKRYTGLLSMKDGKPINKIFSRGTEDVKKSNTLLGKKVFKEFTLKLFDDTFTQKDAIDYVEMMRYKLEYDMIPVEDLIITIRVSKSIENYKVLSTHSKLAKRLIESGDLLPIVEGEKKIGTRLEYIMLQDKNGVLVSEYTGNFDREYYWAIQTYAPIKRLLECVYKDYDWGQFISFRNTLTLF